MNTFDFIGRISIPKNKEDFIKKTKNGTKYISFMVKQNENNSAFVHMYGDKLRNGQIPVRYIPTQGIEYIPYEKRFEEDILRNVYNRSKYILAYDNQRFEFIWKDDFMENFYEVATTLPANTIYHVWGDYQLVYRNGKPYNNFNIRCIKVENSSRPELKMKLELFYNHNSFDETDKKNKFVLNAYISQYVYANKRKEYFPLQVQFITNRFDFKKQTDVDIIRHRKENLYPDENLGYVKAIWEAQYVRGAQLILPPLETLPKDIQFEIENAGRDIQEYMSNVVGTANEFICLTRPNNTLNKDGAVYTPLDIPSEEFEKLINQQSLENTGDSIDKIAEKDSTENPFN